MIDVEFSIGNLDLHSLLSTYHVSHEVEYQDSMVSINGTEYGTARYRPVISFSLIPLTDDQCESLYDALSNSDLSVTYTNPYLNDDVTGTMRVMTALESVFGLRSIDGNRYYKGSTITLRQRTVI